MKRRFSFQKQMLLFTINFAYVLNVGCCTKKVYALHKDRETEGSCWESIEGAAALRMNFLMARYWFIKRSFSTYSFTLTTIQKTEKMNLSDRSNTPWNLTFSIGLHLGYIGAFRGMYLSGKFSSGARLLLYIFRPRKQSDVGIRDDVGQETRK